MQWSRVRSRSLYSYVTYFLRSHPRSQSLARYDVICKTSSNDRTHSESSLLQDNSFDEPAHKNRRLIQQSALTLDLNCKSASTLFTDCRAKQKFGLFMFCFLTKKISGDLFCTLVQLCDS